MGLPGEGRVEKRFRVAREGQTVDGRELNRQEIQDMADTYNPEHYAARINIEHFAGWSPEPPFNAYGDVIKVEAIEVNGKLCLYNTISALPNFVTMNKKGQKIFPSIEFYRNFAGTGKAYQSGLGMTDNPASLGTEALKFSSNQFALRTQPDAEIYMTIANPAADTPSATTQQKGALEQIKSFLTPQPKQQEPDDDFEKAITAGVIAALNGIKELNEKLSKLTPPTAESAPSAVATVTPTIPPAVQNTEQPAAAAPQDQFTQAMTPLLEAINSLSTQLQTLSSTPVNTPPAAAGGNADQVDF